MTLNKTLIAAAAAVTTFIISTAAAMAVPAQATAAVNVRTGGGTSFAIVDQLYAGEAVDVVQCEGGWCYVQHDGPDGWVSGNYLTNAAPANPPSNPPSNTPDCGFGLTLGGGTPTFSINCGNGSAPPPPPAPAAQVCFYNGNNYTAQSFCVAPGTSVNNLAGFWNNKISSIKVQGGASVTICEHPGFGGFCNTWNANVPSLGFLNNKISSYQVN